MALRKINSTTWQMNENLHSAKVILRETGSAKVVLHETSCAKVVLHETGSVKVIQRKIGSKTWQMNKIYIVRK